ncbi:serine hydrolase [Kordia jejudonensis]|uniref:serine hydrolase n=1 Tax=Kordia jejudonensis TaxID=1348245 RepID=UPI00062988B2|nr:serine hydrolase [Kordia jejudonensis]
MKKLLLLPFLVLFSCTTQEKMIDPIQVALASDSEKIQKVMQNLDAHEVQIMLTDSEGNDFSFQIDDDTYFYPASSVKFPVALLALEKVNEIPEVDSNSLLSVKDDSLQTTIRKEVQKIFAISDNEAYNRLFEFLGQDEIHEKLLKKGLQPARISHRVGTQNADNSMTRVISFYKNDSIAYSRQAIENETIEHLQLNKIQKGKGFYKNDTLVNAQMDFSKKNYLPISTLHELMKRIQFPEKYTESEQFQITESDREFLLDVMHKTPKQQGFTDDEYYDSYVKFFMFGDSETPMPDHIKIYNKVGYAYGYLTDCAHIIDLKNNISFTVTATIHVNENRIFNDDTYEYDEIGIPFLAELGRQIHQFYLNKQKK